MANFASTNRTMKKLFFLALLLSFSHSSFAQTYVYELAPDSMNSGRATYITELSNGNIAVAIQDGRDHEIMEFSNLGNQIRSYTAGSGSNYAMGHVEALPNGNFLQTGHSQYTRRGTFVLRDSIGAVLRDTFLRESSWSGALTYINDVVTDANGNVYFVGRVYDIFSGGVSFYSWTIPFIGKLNSNLSMQWVRTFSVHDSRNRRRGDANGICIDPDGNLAVVGYHSSGNGSTARDYLVKFNPNGLRLWAKEMLNASVTGTPTKIVSSSSGAFFTMEWQSASPHNGVRIDKFSKGGTYLWSKTIRSATEPLGFGGMDINA